MLAGGLVPPATAQAASAGNDAPLVLINGSLAHFATGTGEPRLTGVVPAGRGLGWSMLTLRLGGRTYAIPSAALPYLGHGLAPSLFDLGLLRSAESGGRLPVQISFTGTAPTLPGITVTQTGPGSAQGYLTATSAKAFGAALAHQFATDHALGDYGSAGLFTGGVSISLPGTAPPAQAASPGLVMHTLTVRGRNLHNKPDTGDVAWVFNVDNPILFDDFGSLNFFFHGVTKFSVPAGHYWAIGDFFNLSAAGAASERLTVLPQFTAGANTSITLREARASSKITAVTPRPSSPSQTVLELKRPGPAGASTLEWLDIGLPLWISPTSHRPTVGNLQVFTYQQRLSPPHSGTRPYEYDLAFQATHGIIPPQRHVVTDAQLATVNAAYYQAVPSRGGFVRFGLFPAQYHDFLLLLISPLRLPRRQTEYMSAGPGLVWVSQFWQSYQTLAGGQSQALRELRAGQHLADSWNAYPLHPGPNVRLPAPANAVSVLPSASRQGNTLTLDITPFTDNQPGHLGAGFFPGFGSSPKLSGRYEIDQNGVKIAGGDAVAASTGLGDLLTSASLDRRRSVIRFELDATRTGSGYPLSTSSQTVWTWRSVRGTAAELPRGWVCGSAVTGSPSRSCVVQPMMTLRYRVAGLSLAGQTAPGRQVLDLAAGHLQLGGRSRITHAEVQVSFDGGTTWQPASVTRLGHGHYRAVFTAPGSSYVTLRIAAHDAAGGQISETTLRAYQTKA
jgi:hypothetical protein